MKSVVKTNGVAIVSVLIIVAIVAIIGSKMSVNQQRFVKSSQLMLDTQQQILHALSIEAWAEDLLVKDLIKSDENPHHKIDTFLDNWHNATLSFEEGRSFLSGEITDLQSKINLNNLAAKNNNDYLSQLYLLFDALGIKRVLADPLLDYLDSNDNRYSQFGAESNYYTTLERPYKIANSAMTDISELNLIKGFSAGIIRRLQPWVWIGPKTVNKININTASKIVLKSLSINLKDEILADVLKKQQNEGFKSVDEFIAFIGDVGVKKKLLTSSSAYFLLESNIDSPSSGLTVNTYLYRDNSKKTVAKVRRVFL